MVERLICGVKRTSDVMDSILSNSLSYRCLIRSLLSLALKGLWIFRPMGLTVFGSLGLLVSGSPGLRVSGPPGLWATGRLGLWFSGPLGLWVSGSLGLWASAFLVLWFSGSLGLWVSGSLGSLGFLGLFSSYFAKFARISCKLGLAQQDFDRGVGGGLKQEHDILSQRGVLGMFL